ncbi:BUD3 [Candida theae]|uniref:BUD3 n=1 Tax=Candida theae TaxID=1198502 RepID=A0AAD5BKV0_9ASCO|nr:BUD3 [Candida theae]KAI5968626.1 BUD3 [Candida theae]
MSLYVRYVSGEHDIEHFRSKQPKTKANGIQLPFFTDDFEGTTSSKCDQDRSLLNWLKTLHGAAIFVGHDATMFRHVISIVYQRANKSKLCTQTITKFGPTLYPDLVLDSSSRFWPSCENLLPQHQKSHVRKALAISNLKNSNRTLNHHVISDVSLWDETNAGALASSMSLLQNCSPDDLGRKLLDLGLVQNQNVCAFTVDVIYDNESSKEEIVEENNQLVSLLGEQLDQIFDPLLEYAPEEMRICYKPSLDRKPVHFQSSKIHSIVEELINVQTNYTAGLVNLLQTFIIPLRTSVMERDRTDQSSAIQKINQTFPPTIDEIARVNCLLNDALLKARRLDDIEVIIAMGTILPYFYKPFIRHEANVKHFNENLTKFAQKHAQGIFENLKINPSQYTVREIDSVVTGVLLELPKFKLLLQRLHAAIEAEEAIARNFDNGERDDVFLLIDRHYKSAIDVIYAFSGADEQKIETKKRVFTPTGRMLTKLAGNWPPELQLDWNTRKVVGIFELQNVAPRKNATGLEVLVVFSDHLLFFEVEDGFKDDCEEQAKVLSVADALMHSLINEKPMPKLDAFPKMEVSAWCRIDEALVTKYLTLNEVNSAVECVRFLSLNPRGFQSSNSKPRVFSGSYKVIGERATAADIIIAIEKSKILDKSSSFHLFRSLNNALNINYVAQSTSDYDSEALKSPFALVLNLDVDVPSYFDHNPQLLLLLHASIVSEHAIRITGFDKCARKQINEVVESAHFASFIEQLVGKSFCNLFSTYNTVTQNLIEGNSVHLEYLVENLFSDFDKRGERDWKTSDTTRIVKSSVNSPSNSKKSPTKSNSSRSSIFTKIHLKKSKRPIVHTPELKPKTTRKLSNTFIPQGTKLEYKEIYKPIPTLSHRRPSSTSTVIENKSDEISGNLAPAPALASVPEHTNANNRCVSEPSIEILPNFKFPDPNNMDEIETNAMASSSIHDFSTIRRLSTMDDISVVLKLSQEPSFGDYLDEDSDQTPNWEFFNARDEAELLVKESSEIWATGHAGVRDEIAEEEDEDVQEPDRHNPGASSGDEALKRNRGAARTSKQEPDSTIPMFTANSTSPRKPSNESSIFSHAGGTPISPHTFATPQISSNQDGVFTTRLDCNQGHQTPKGKLASHFPRDESVKSITAREYAIEFSQLIDAEFSKPPLDAAIGSYYSSAMRKTAPSSPSTATLTPFRTNASVDTLVSNSSGNMEGLEVGAELNFAGDEVVVSRAPLLLHKELKNTQDTLIAKYEPKSIQSSETTTKPLSEYMRDDSIAQLTNLLQNSIRFSDFEVDKFC